MKPIIKIVDIDGLDHIVYMDDNSQYWRTCVVLIYRDNQLIDRRTEATYGPFATEFDALKEVPASSTERLDQQESLT
jgi:hypothetical protein